MREFIADFVTNDSGATAIEYGLIASGIGLTLILAIQAIGTGLNLSYTSIATNF
jgi:pilus assembly protein Flp/PilA